MRELQKTITYLNFDDTLVKQKLLSEYPKEMINCFDIPSTQGYCTIDSLVEIQRRLSKRNLNGVTFLGNGNYHYVSYLLLSEIKEPFSLVLFDYHTDLMQSPSEDLISCGSWVSKAINDFPMLEKVCIIGANLDDEYFKKEDLPENILIIDEKKINSLSVLTLTTEIHSFIGQDSIYISIDKDVLNMNNAHTNWDQGSMTLLELLYFIRELNQTNKIIGLDVCGELPLSPLETLLPDNINEVHKNEIANRAILDILNSDLAKT